MESLCGDTEESSEDISGEIISHKSSIDRVTLKVVMSAHHLLSLTMQVLIKQVALFMHERIYEVFIYKNRKVCFLLCTPISINHTDARWI